MKIVLQCEKCGCIIIDHWAEIDDSGRLSLGRWNQELGGHKHWELPYCESCKSDELIIGGTVSISGLKIP
jgi:hypothetical protein